MISFPCACGYLRPWAIEAFDLSEYPALAANWARSREIHIKIREALRSADLPPGVRTVAVAGSLGRMEASDLSDADLIIVLHDRIDPHSSEAHAAFERVWHALGPLRMPEPKVTGVFSTPCTESQLCGVDVGSAEEELRVFGKRLLLLLESQPVFRDDDYTALMDAIVRRYAPRHLRIDSQKDWTFMLHDLLRYFRALCVNYQWDFENDIRKWPLRNIKLRHSRLIMYGGLLFLLGEASRQEKDRIHWLRSRLCLTPLERMASVYHSNHDLGFPRVARCYDFFLSKMNDKNIRDLLLFCENGEPDPNRDESCLQSTYASLKANSDSLVSELLRFVLSRRSIWPEHFFEDLLF